MCLAELSCFDSSLLLASPNQIQNYCVEIGERLSISEPVLIFLSKLFGLANDFCSAGSSRFEGKIGIISLHPLFYHNTIMLNVVQIRPLSLLENDTSGQVLQNLQNGMCT